jgi:methionyl-tRNA synthetase
VFELQKFYITTPIYYVTDKPHLGTAYTTIVADMLARWHRLKGEEVFFLTGTDEHGEKVEAAAKKAGKQPKEFVDLIVEDYKDIWSKLDLSYDYFIRTSDKNHEELVAKFIEKIMDSGDIYKGEYAGWYCVPDETFWTELQLKDGKCPECGREVKWLKEESYFFKLSKYQEALLKFYEDNPEFLSPKWRSKEITNRVREGLKDISITRTTIKWGIPFPKDKTHTIYVWVDALCNYITALDWPGGERFKTFWPADVHLIGKEINWFHSVIWPAMLFSAGVEPPKKVFAHGWWTVDGKKMGKSLGNMVNPVEMANKYSLDAFRYALIKEMPLGDDGDFSEKGLATRLNNELAAELGNLLSRTVTLAERFTGAIKGTPELEKSLNIGSIDKKMDDLDMLGAINEIFAFIKSVNKYINDKKPWNLEGEELSNSLYNLLESCRIVGILVWPFMPGTSDKMLSQLGVQRGTLADCKFGEFKGKVKKGEHLFKKIE